MTRSKVHAGIQEDPDLSVVIPVYNEVDNIRPLVSALEAVLSDHGIAYEIIFVDDGSSDGTAETLRALHARRGTIKVILFRNNFGQSAAMAAGFARACGKVIVTMDGDMQNDPLDIPRLVSKLEEGYDVVSGWRKKRHDTFLLRRIPSMIANRLISTVTQTHLHDSGCALKAYRREIVKRLSLYGENHRFLPALSKMEGARIAEMVVAHHPRRFGRSKYNLSRTFKVIMDLLTLNLFMKYIRNPLGFFGRLGVLFGMAGLLVLVLVARDLWMAIENGENLNVLITLAFLCCAASFQFIFFGLLAKLIVESGVRKHDYYFDVTSTAEVEGVEG